MALSYKTKDRLYYILVVLLLVVPVAFAVLFHTEKEKRNLLKLRRDRIETFEELAAQLKMARSQIAQPDKLPRNRLVEEHKKYQEALLSEYAALAKYYLKHDAVLERHILKGDRVDEIKIVLNYTNELKPRWANKVGNPDFLENWEWERPDGKLELEQFAEVEKWCCVVDTVVDSLTAEGYVKVDRLVVGEPFTPASLPKVLLAGWPRIRYKVIPVRVSFSAPFRNLSKLLRRFVQRPDDAACTEITRLELATERTRSGSESATKPKGWVFVSMEIWVYDLYWAGSG